MYVCVISMSNVHYYSKNFIEICKKTKQIWLPNMEYKRHYRCEGTYISYKCQKTDCLPNTSRILVFCIYSSGSMGVVIANHIGL